MEKSENELKAGRETDRLPYIFFCCFFGDFIAGNPLDKNDMAQTHFMAHVHIMRKHERKLFVFFRRPLVPLLSRPVHLNLISANPEPFVSSRLPQY